MSPDPADLLGLISLAALDRASKGPFTDDGSLTEEAQAEVRRISELASDDEADLEELAVELDAEADEGEREAFAEGQPCKSGQTVEKTGCVPASGEKGDKTGKKTSGPSKAKVELAPYRDLTRVTAAVQRVLGESATLQDVASAVGATDDATVTMANSDNGVKVLVEHPSYTAERFLSRDAAGVVHCENEIIKIKPGAQGAGLGSEIFARQVEQAARLGVSFLRCDAARTNSRGQSLFNGYYTWPRLGYDQSLGDLEAQGEAALAAQIRQRFPGAESVLDLFQTKEGRDWWKENGVGLKKARFDLREGSRSRQVLEAYLEERAGRVSRHAEESGSVPVRNSDEAEEIDLTPEEEEALERAWRRLAQEWGE